MYEILYLNEDGNSFSVTVKANNNEEAVREADKVVISDGMYDINDYTQNKVYLLK
jgi:cation diffusion facilitator CzcD-associated flavoprotein CzcO